jgi:hypothetical protein
MGEKKVTYTTKHWEEETKKKTKKAKGHGQESWKQWWFAGKNKRGFPEL